MQYQTFNINKTPLQGGFYNRSVLAIIAVFMLFTGILFSAVFLIFSAIIAPLIGLRIWWLKRLYKSKIMPNHTETDSHLNSNESSVIEAEYTVIDNKRSN